VLFQLIGVASEFEPFNAILMLLGSGQRVFGIICQDILYAVAAGFRDMDEQKIILQ
jgi:hypothetical protein